MFEDLITTALAVPGWRSHGELLQVAQYAHGLGDGAVIAEIGCLFGRTTIALAGARRLRGSGTVHCVDAFNGDGDDFSVPYYRRMRADHGGADFRHCFERYLAAAALQDWVTVHAAYAEAAARTWSLPLDMLVLDADQSPAGARRIYDAWLPHLRPGGILVISNSGDRPHDAGHDGNALIAEHCLRPPAFAAVIRGDTTIATWVGGGS